MSSFHRRPLLPPSVALNSIDGRTLFTTALTEGNMEGYFPLAENYVTQAHPAFCGLGSLTMALNALLIDPQRQWQGSWRWFDDNMLDCCEPLDVVKVKGITLSKLACLARCNGATAMTSYASEITVEDFRRDVMSVLSTGIDRSNRKVLICSYHRGTLAQTGAGHFSPVGGYCAAQDMVLIMDVARFKYPPHWVPLPLLFQSMNEPDTETKKCRGYAVLSVGDSDSERLSSCICQHSDDDEDDKVDAIASKEGRWEADAVTTTPEKKVEELHKVELKKLIDHSCSLCQP